MEILCIGVNVDRKGDFMKRIYYAKSDTRETIKQHTDKLLENLERLKSGYQDEILKAKNIDKERFFYLLEIVCKYHDIGKVFTPFQNMIREKIKQEEEKEGTKSDFVYEKLETKFIYNIKHEQLSPMFVPVESLGLSLDEKRLVYQAIYYHHERENKEVDNVLVSKIIEEDIKPQLEFIKNEMEFEIEEKLSPIYIRYIRRRICEGDALYNEYCLLKGLLHRLDHSSSGQMEVEEITNEKVADFIKSAMQEKGHKENDLQEFTTQNQDENILVIGSTGIGKTEAALLWANREKTFFTLPIRISINAIFDRITEEIHYKHVGLLHSTALEYLKDKKESEQEFENEQLIYDQTKNLCSKITTCTIDQIFPFVFKYKGYEKMYATLAYSKVIIDEIQAYSPEIVAVILKGIQMIHNIGGKFMIMTATLPRIYKEQLEKMGIQFQYDKFIKPVERHKIKLNDMEIVQDLENIKEKSKNSKVLIIVNTVSKAIEMYEKLQELECENIHLLHSRFMMRDRSQKEKQIIKFSKTDGQNGIWITTQIVEASLDIDFDYLFTEMSTLDSLFQRLGRCFRNREYKNQNNPNVYIYTKNSSGIGRRSVYNDKIHENSIALLKDFDETILKEDQKIKLVDQLYSREMLEKTEFLEDFESGMEVLDNLVDYDVNKSEAQKLLRNIENVTVIPKTIYEENIELFEKYKASKSTKEKNEIKREMMKLTTNISLFQSKKLREFITEIPGVEHKEIQLIDMKYDNQKGLMLEETEEDDWDKRSF